MSSWRTLLILIVIFGVLYWLDIKGSSSFISDKIKVVFLDIKDDITLAYQKHFEQAQMVADYKKQTHAYEQLKLAYANLNARNQALALEVYDLEKLQEKHVRANQPQPLFSNQNNICTPDQTLDLDNLLPQPTFTLTRIYGFVSLDNPYQVFLDIKKPYPKDKILGMVAFNRVLGTVVQREGRFVGLLHGDSQMSYSVMIRSGGKVYYGFVTNESFKSYINFLPTYAPIKVGDQVFTSGLDHIFSPNIYVGTIASVENHYVYKKALLQIEDFKSMLFYTTIVDVP
ncbi:rod shape-determining protein MreC [Helicobacter suis]|uniref:rod shape-determining protein MreC n=1 Tax=Helicobacter suis TaxID=104628 RepID=UPI000301B148|nr:rod shape-determining protein MreC [Helicobacter suis]BDR28342.1 rod shape-determining protein MreC [Helicobacter suis HS1]